MGTFLTGHLRGAFGHWNALEEKKACSFLSYLCTLSIHAVVLFSSSPTKLYFPCTEPLIEIKRELIL